MAKKIPYTDCSVCSQRVRVDRVDEHLTSIHCKVQQIHNRHEEQGWICVNATHARILKDAGVPTVDEEAGIHAEEEVVGRETKGSIRKLKTVYIERTHEVTFAPRGALTVLLAIQRIPTINKDLRRRAVRALFTQSADFSALFTQSADFSAQVETVKRLGGNVRSYVWRLVHEAEKAEEGERSEPALAQDSGHGEEASSAG